MTDEHRIIDLHKYDMILIKGMLIFLALMLLVGITQGALTDSLISYYSYENSYTDNKTRNLLSAVGVATKFSDAKKLGLYSLNVSGTSYAEKQTPIGFNGGDMDFTLNTWFKSASLPTEGTVQHLISIGDSSVYQNSHYFGLYALGGKYKFLIQSSSNNPASNNFTNINTNTWYMGTHTYNASIDTSCFYMNGTSYGCTAHTAYNFHMDRLKIGAMAFATGSTWQGLIDETSIFNKTLSAEEVASIYNSGSGWAYPFENVTPPAATNQTPTPTDLQLISKTDTTIKVNWTGIGNTYEVFLQDDPFVNTTNKEYTFINLLENTTYYIYIKEYNFDYMINLSNASDYIIVTTDEKILTNQTPTPQNFAISNIGIYNMTLSWISQGDKILIYRDSLNIINTTSASYIDTPLSPNTNYTYYIKAYSLNYTSNLSNASSTIIRATEILYNPFNITFNAQEPPTLNVSSIIEKMINISYIVSIGTYPLNLSSIKLNHTILNGKIYVNKTLISHSALHASDLKSYTYNNSNIYYFQLFANDILSGTYNLPYTLYENTSHSSVSMDANSVMKIYLYNISMTAPFRYIEVMCNNTASTINVPINIYIANSSYSTGSLGVANTQLIYTIPDGNTYSHCHRDSVSNSRYSCHHVIPSSLNLSIGSTEVMQILIPGRNSNNVVCYHIPYKDYTYFSTNGGTSYAQQVYALDAHFHQLESNETLKYQGIASDNNQTVSTSWLYSGIGYSLFPPTNVNINSPYPGTYDSTILINHSVCQSLVPIDTYKYEYSDGVTFNTIASNDYPSVSYLWDSGSISSGNYFVRFTCTDTTGLYSYADTPIFSISHTSSSTNATIVALDKISESNILVSEGLKLIAYIILFLAAWAVLLYNLWEWHSFIVSILSLTVFMYLRNAFINSSEGFALICIMGAVVSSISLFSDLYYKTQRV